MKTPAITGLFATVAAGLAACTTLSLPYQLPSGSEVAVVHTAAPGARILQVDGKGVSALLPRDLPVSSGIRQLGLQTSAGGGSVYQCVTLMLKGGQRYLIRVAGPDRNWAVLVTNEGSGDEVPLLEIVRAQNSCPSLKGVPGSG
jgi:hypothetical protein